MDAIFRISNSSNTLHDEKKPRHIQHALVQLGERMSGTIPASRAGIPSSSAWRRTRWKKCATPTPGLWGKTRQRLRAGFHEALSKMLNDPSPMVRGNAALSLVRFGDASGRPEIVALLQPANVVASKAGTITDTSAVGHRDSPGWSCRQVEADGQTTEVRSPITGRMRTLGEAGQTVAAGAEIATLDPGTEQVWEALRALYLVGQPDDLPAIRPYERDLPDIPDHVRKQAIETEQAIRGRPQSQL